MSGATSVADMRQAMARLHWELRDLFVAAIGHGNVGTETDVARHLRTGTHLTCPQASVLVATLDDALMTIGDPFRVAPRTG